MKHTHHTILLTLLMPLFVLSASAQTRQFTLDELIPGGEGCAKLRADNPYFGFDGDQVIEDSKAAPKPAEERALVREYNIYVKDADGKEHQITTDGSADILYGQSVHRDEFGISSGLFWSPDGKRLAFYRMDQSMVSKYPQVNITPFAQTQVYDQRYTDKQRYENQPAGSTSAVSRCATYEPDAYPMAGEASHKVTVGIYDTEKGTTTYLDCGAPIDRYFTNIAWAPDNRSLYLIEVNRDQTDATLDQYDITTGKKVATLIREHNDKYYEPMQPIRFLPWDATKFIYVSRRDGFNHIYLYQLNDNSAKELRQLTKGDFEVIRFIGFNPSGKSIIYASNESHHLNQSLYSVDMKAKRRLLGNAEGWHSATKLSASGKFIIDSYSTPTSPRIIDLINTQTGKARNLFTAADKWVEGGFNIPEIKVGTLKAADGKTDLYYRMVMPVGFDPSKKYPAIIYVYGGPHAHNIDNSYRYATRGWDIYMAQRGYVMLCVDNRGSEHRGLEFEQATFRQLGWVEMQDQLKGVELLRSLPYVDSNRLGVHGWSFGGYMTTSLLCSFDDDDIPNGGYTPAANGTFHGKCPFRAGVAGGPVIDWRFYEVMYGERYMDTPQTNPEGYANTTLLNKAQNLRGRLMIIYGYNDPTCVPQHTLSFLRACIDKGTYPDLFTYPGDGHNMFQKDRVHLHEVITRYFEDHLGK